MTEPAGRDDDEGLHDLARRAGTGDERAFVSLVEQLESTIRRWALRLSGDADSADDLTQLTLIRLHERVGQFDHRSRMTSWLYRMMRNLAADRRREDMRRRTREQQASIGMDLVVVPDEDTGADARLAGLVESYRSVLTPREQEVFELVELRGLAVIEAAARLRVAPATARVLLLRARRRLRALMLADFKVDEGEVP